MSKRDRAARAKGAADADATDVEASEVGTGTTESATTCARREAVVHTARQGGVATVAGDDSVGGGVALKERPDAAPEKERDDATRSRGCGSSSAKSSPRCARSSGRRVRE